MTERTAKKNIFAHIVEKKSTICENSTIFAA
jgi:hypothetical protein